MTFIYDEEYERTEAQKDAEAVCRLGAENEKLKEGLRKVCASTEIMEARRFARESLEALKELQ